MDEKLHSRWGQNSWGLFQNKSLAYMERVGKIQMCKFLLAIKHDPSICLSLIYD